MYLDKLSLLLIGVSLIYCLPNQRPEDGRPIVTVPQGVIAGVNETVSEFDIFAFRSIPYAEPPRNELRFMAPVPSGPWEGELDASNQPQRCNQFFLGREDCLYLNVYTPATTNETEPLAVMVFIYGGAFMLGDVTIYNRVFPLLRKDVIVAMMNYRVGVMGFFSTGDSVAPGNQGLMDQTLALKWVKENIEYFGGDSNRITIFGESAGAASVHYQLLAPSAAGLFNSAIMESGTTFAPWAQGRDFEEVSVTLGEKFNCDLSNSTTIVDCLQSTLAVRLSRSTSDFTEWNMQPWKFAPRVDGTYIPDQPATLIKNGNYYHVPVMTGTNRDDGSFIAGEMVALDNILKELNNNFSFCGPISLHLYEDEDPINTATSAYEYYIGGTNVTEDEAQELSNLLTDELFHIPSDLVGIVQSQYSPVYIYELDHRGLFSLASLYSAMGVEDAANWISHFDDVPYIIDFGLPFSPEDDQLREIMTDLWTNFAKYGNPTPTTETIGFLWPQATASNLQHLSLDDVPSMQDDTRSESRAFWRSLPLRINDLLFN